MTEVAKPPTGPPAFDRLMAGYGAAFDRYDLEAILDHYHTPCFIHKDGRAIFLTDETQKRAYFQDLLRSLRAAEVHHSDILSLDAVPLGSSAAVVTVRWVSKKEAGEVVWDFLDSYYVVNVGQQWKFVGDTVHEGDYAKATAPTQRQ